MNDELSYINHYFDGELSTEEKKAFEERCLSDPAFAKMVAFYISLQEHLQQPWIESIEQQFNQLEVEAFSANETFFSKNGELEINEHYWKEEMESGDINSIGEKENKGSLKELASVRLLQEESKKKGEAKVRSIKWWKTLAVAAAVLGIIATGVTLYMQNTQQGTTVAVNPNKGDSTKGSSDSNDSSTQNNSVADSAVKQADKKQETPKKRLDKAEQQQLFAQNFVPDAPPKQRTEFLEVAFDYYENGSYKQANTEYTNVQKVVENLTTRKSGDEQQEAERKRILFYAYYYNALSYMAAGNATKAISELKAIKESPDGYWRSKQQWYLALAYLKTGEVVKATTLLQQVAASKQAGEYRQKAIQLSKALQ